MSRTILYTSIVGGISINLAIAQDMQTSTKCLNMVTNPAYDNKLSYTISGLPKRSSEEKQILQSGTVRDLKEAKTKLRELAAKHHTKVCTTSEIRKRQRQQ